MRTAVLIAAICVGYVLGAGAPSSRKRTQAAQPVNHVMFSTVVRAERTVSGGVESGVARRREAASTVWSQANQDQPLAVK